MTDEALQGEPLTILLVEKLKRIPVVVPTTSGAEQDVARSYDFHANSYVVKPLDFDKFTRLMDDLGFYWLAWNQIPWLQNNP